MDQSQRTLIIIALCVIAVILFATHSDQQFSINGPQSFVSNQPQRSVQCTDSQQTITCSVHSVKRSEVACEQPSSPVHGTLCFCNRFILGWDCDTGLHGSVSCSSVCEQNNQLVLRQHESQLCPKWHDTQGCGVLESPLLTHDKKSSACKLEWIEPARAGFCECGFGVVLVFDCNHRPILCIDACMNFLSTHSLAIQNSTADITLEAITQGIQTLQSTIIASANTASAQHSLSLQCIGWRHTSTCAQNLTDRAFTCNDVIPSHASGVCECSHGRTFPFKCGHQGLQCSEVCGGLQTPGYESVSGPCKAFYRMGKAGTLPCDMTIPPRISGWCDCHDGPTPIRITGHVRFTCSEQCRLQAEANRVVRAGYRRMRQETCVFVTLTRNEGERLPGTIEWIEKTGNLFRSYQAVVLEEDSTDNTVEVLQNWAVRNNRVVVDSRHEASATARQFGAGGSYRFQRMTALRNRSLDKLRNPLFEAATFVIIVDSDMSLGWDLEGIAHSFGLLEHPTLPALPSDTFVDWKSAQKARYFRWDAMCSNGGLQKQLHTYYDSLAHIDEAISLHNFRELQRIIFNPLDPPMAVGSCFGGLAIYRKQALLKCSYDVLNKSEAAEWNCEHHGLHRCMNDHGFRVMLNPKQLSNYPTDWNAERILLPRCVVGFGMECRWFCIKSFVVTVGGAWLAILWRLRHRLFVLISFLALLACLFVH